MPTLEIRSLFATVTDREFGAFVRNSWRSSAVSASMKLCVDPESSNARKSRPLTEIYTCIVWLVVIPVTALSDI